MPLDTINVFLGIGAIALQVFALAFLIAYVLRNRYPNLGGIQKVVSQWGLWMGLAVTAGAAAFSLVHSFVFGLAPCDLCWWQRIFIYPQVFLFAIALWRKDTSVTVYSIALSVIGIGIALYHHALQMLPHSALPCPATGPSCSQILFLEFGYVTYPMLSVSLFAFLIVTMLLVRSASR